MAVELFAPDTIDRVTPTQRPAERTVMRHRWAELLFLHWIVPQEQLHPFLPPGLELDTFEGNAYIGLIPFTITGARPTWAPAFRPLSNFHEINLRTYVHRKGRDPGVWFFSLDAASATAVRIARAAWKLPYHFAKMKLWVKPDKTSGYFYSERRWPGPLPAGCEIEFTVEGPAAPAAVGTLEHFLAERYILYSYRKGQLYSGQVHHVPYPLQKASVQLLEENLSVVVGIKLPDAAPIAHYAHEVDVRVFPLKQV